jgi:glucan phosphoethanolaminetransferase (alkaline phosphatase superfamily)
MILLPSFVTRHPYFKSIPALSPITLIGLTAIFVFYAYNAAFWTKAIDIFAGHPVSMIGYVLAVYFLLVASFSLFGFPWVVKRLCQLVPFRRDQDRRQHHAVISAA